MKISHTLASAMVVCAVATTLKAHETHYLATFSGPDPAATGTAMLTLNDDHSALSYSITLEGLDLGGQTGASDDDVLGLHFHNAPAGGTGPIVFGLLGSAALGGPLNPALTDDANDLMVDAGAGTITGVWEASDSPELTAALVDLLDDESLYLNVHTPAFTGGATRGQIAVVPEPASILLVGAGLFAVIANRRR